MDADAWDYIKLLLFILVSVFAGWYVIIQLGADGGY